MTTSTWVALIVVFDVVAVTAAWTVVHVGTRKPWPCMDQEHPCAECEEEDL